MNDVPVAWYFSAMNNTFRAWLIAALTHQKLPVLAEQQYEELVDRASIEGIVVLVEKSIARHPQFSSIPAELQDLFRAAAKQTIFQQLVFQGEQQTVFAELNKANIAFIVMKGAALAQWLYQSPTDRSITDIDIWFKDKPTVMQLSKLLQPLGFVAQPALGELTTHEQAFDKTAQNSTIRLDAHWALFNSAILSASLDFELTYKNAPTIEIQNQFIKVLSANDALINSIGHRALKYLSGQADTLKWLLDQHLLFVTLNPAQWQELVTQSAELGISDLTLDAIEQSQKNFNTHAPQSLIDALSHNAKQEKIKRDWFQSWSRYQWHEILAVSPSLSVRLQWLGQKLFPNPDAVREGYGNQQSAWKVLLNRFAVAIGRLFR